MLTRKLALSFSSQCAHARFLGSTQYSYTWLGCGLGSGLELRSDQGLGLGLGLGLDEVLVDRVLVRDLRVELTQQPVNLVRV